MKKVLASVFLGAALLASCGSAFAEAPRQQEARWGIRPARSAPALLDFARWLSQRFGGVLGSVEAEPMPAPEPEPAPVASPAPGATPDAVCAERIHCPIG